jgi:NAD(P)-dependent dehydrogenase (short-subunit alcohol dehydrogenase family)
VIPNRAVFAPTRGLACDRGEDRINVNAIASGAIEASALSPISA